MFDIYTYIDFLDFYYNFCFTRFFIAYQTDLLCKMFSPSFTLQLKHNITPGTAAVGKYDGTHPCLTCGTSAAKVGKYLMALFIH